MKPALPFSMLVKLCVVLVSFSLSLSSFAAGTLEKIEKSGTVLLGYRDVASPFSFPDGKGKGTGYTVDICLNVAEAIRVALKRPDITTTFVQVSSKQRNTMLSSGEIDLECGATTNLPERREVAAFTIPTFIAGVRILAKKGSGIKTSYDLHGKKIVVINNASGEKVITQQNQTRSLNATILMANNGQDAFAMLESGKVDAFAHDDIMLANFIAASKTPEAYTLTTDMLTIEPLAIMMRKNDPEFKKVVDAEVMRLITSRTINAIYTKWFESPIPPDGINLKQPMSYLLRDSFKSPTDWVPH